MSNLGSLTVELSANTVKLQSDLGKAAAVADARSREIARSFSVVQNAIASQRGISTDVLKPYIQQLEATTARQGEASHAMEEFSFKTAGAKRELLVLAHELSQGNYSKFGGSMLVLGERTGAASLLFSKAGLAALGLAGAAAAVVATIVQASNEVNEFNKALTGTGNYVGKTIDDLNRLSAAVANSTHSSQHSAAEVAAAVAASGKISGDSLQLVSEGALAMSKTLGISVDDAVGYFTKLSEDPAKNSAKFNETLHYLTASTYEQIKALDDLGQKEQAGSLAEETLAKAAKVRQDDAINHLGVFARAWQMLAADALKTWNIIANVGRPETNAEKLQNAQNTLADKLSRGPLNSTTGDAYNKGLQAAKDQVAALQEVIALEKKQAGIQAEQAKTEQAGIRAVDAVDKWQKQAKGIDSVNRELDKYRKQLDDIRKVNPNSALLDPKAIAAGEDAIRKSFSGPKGAAPKAFQDDAATKYIERLNEMEASLKAQLGSEGKITEAQKLQAQFTQLIADLKEKKVLTTEQKQLLAGEAAIKAKLDELNAVDALVEKKKQEAKLDETKLAFAKQLQGINLAMASAQDSRNEQNDRMLGAFGLGDRAQQEVEAQKAIRKEYSKYLLSATEKASAVDPKTGFNALGSQAYQDEVEKIKTSLAAALAVQEKYYADIKAKQGDWSNGATKALANYVDSVNNVAAATESAMTNAFKGAEDALTTFATTGKLSVKSLADSIIANMARIAIQQTITGPLAKGLLSILSGSANAAGGANSTGFGSGAGFGNMDLGLALANGGSPPLGKISLVGEQGPELFVPSQSGTIIPNGAFGGGSGGQHINVVINNTVGDVATLSQLREAQAGTERRIAAQISRSQRYAGSMS